MRSLKPTLIAAVLVMTLLASGIASADRRGGGHYGHYRSWSHHHGPRVRVGVGIGWPFWDPWWYHPRYYYPYYPPAVAVPSTPPVYIERGEPTPSSTPPGVWYYCPDSKAYYPYVKECPGGWQTVPAQPPPAPVR